MNSDRCRVVQKSIIDLSQGISKAPGDEACLPAVWKAYCSSFHAPPVNIGLPPALSLLTEVHLRGCYLGWRQWCALMHVIVLGYNLQQLDCSCCCLTDDHIRVLCCALCHSTASNLKILVLSNNRMLSNLSAKYLLQILRQFPSIQKVDINETGISEVFVAKLIQAIAVANSQWWRSLIFLCFVDSSSPLPNPFIKSKQLLQLFWKKLFRTDKEK